MFKNGKSKPEPSARDVTVINRGTTVEGEVKVAGTIRIYGRLNGTVRSEGKVIVAEDGVLSGDLYAEAADVSGTVEGIIEADRLDLRSTATVEGNVIVKKFTTETGAIFIGDCKMPQNGPLPSGQPAESPAEDEETEAASNTAADNGEESKKAKKKQAKASSKSAGDGGLKPLPNKPGDAAEQGEDEETEDQSEGEARPRFW